MQHLYSPQLRAERLIAWARLTLACFSFAAVWLDPVRAVAYGQPLHALLASYALYSLGVLAVLWRAGAPLPYPVARHVVDLIVLSLFLYVSAGTTSPLFPFFAFLLVTASLRWRWRGTLWTAAVMLLSFPVVGLGAALARPASFELHEYIIRCVSLVVTAVLLAEMGAYEERGRRDMEKLAAEPEVAADDWHALVRYLPSWAAQVMGAKRTLIAWEESDEPWLHLASYEGGESRYAHEAPGVIEPLVADDLVDTNFLRRGAVDPPAPVLCASPTGFRRWQGAPLLHPLLQERFAVTSVLSVRLEGETARGRLFWFDKPGMTSDDLVLGEIVARQVANRLDRFYLLRELAERAVVEERVRMGRDLHDGARHALAGVALELENLVRTPTVELADWQGRLQQIQSALETEQRALRMMITHLRGRGGLGPPRPSLSVRLKDLVERLQRQRGLRVEWRAADLDALQDERADEVYFLIHEGLMNAARHSGGSALRLEASLSGGRVDIVVADNGHGFPFRGRYDLATLTALGLGPATLKERVALLDGRLTVDSTERGTRLEISLPAAPAPLARLPVNVRE